MADRGETSGATRSTSPGMLNADVGRGSERELLVGNNKIGSTVKKIIKRRRANTGSCSSCLFYSIKSEEARAAEGLPTASHISVTGPLLLAPLSPAPNSSGDRKCSVIDPWSPGMV